MKNTLIDPHDLANFHDVVAHIMDTEGVHSVCCEYLFDSRKELDKILMSLYFHDYELIIDCREHGDGWGIYSDEFKNVYVITSSEDFLYWLSCHLLTILNIKMKNL